MYEQSIEAFAQAADANRDSELRRGNVVHLPAGASLLLTGDLHGNGPNLLKIEKLADLDANPDRHLLLQELIHPTLGPDDEVTGDESHHVLARVVRMQLRYPGRVHVIMGNHEMAQMTGQDILKAGASICRAFADAVIEHYGDDGQDALAAIYDYFRSLPLAVRSAEGLAAVHSLPADRQVDKFDATVFDRPLTDDDFARGGPAYQVLWGRSIGRPAVQCIRGKLDAQLLVIGHQPQPTGLHVADEDLLIIASDHASGVAVQVDPTTELTARALADRAVYLHAVKGNQ